ncbi:Rrf2 family transcriptional regulator [bacterium]|nr:Rrf2 family transcriptional regulator [bacterium]
MRLSTKGRYGVRAMFDLALRYGQGPIPLKDVSQRQEISVNYLEQLFVHLRRNGLVEGTRGPKGGFFLTKKPGRIKIGDVIRAIEGPISLVYCVDPEERKKECHRADTCITRLLWKRTSEKLAESLDAVTLEDLCEEARRLYKGEEPKHPFAFQI